MYVDKFLKLATGQTHNAASAVAMTDTIDLSKARDLGIGEPLALVINIKTALAGTTPTAAFAVQVDSANTFGSPTTIATSATFSGATSLPVGAQVVVPLPPLSAIMNADPANAEFQFLRGQVTLGGTGPSITFDAQILPLNMIQNYRHYADNITIT